MIVEVGEDIHFSFENKNRYKFTNSHMLTIWCESGGYIEVQMRNL